MLDISIVYRRHFCRISKLFFIVGLSLHVVTPLCAIEYQDGLHSLPRHCEHEWVNRYFNAVDENTDIEEMVDFLVSFKASLQAKGYQCPSLADLCLQVRDILIQRGIEIDDDEIEPIYNEIVKREVVIVQHSSFRQAVNRQSNFNVLQVKKKSKKEAKVSGKMTVGFVKFLGGALCCIVPFPPIQAVGTALATSGIIDMVDAAKEQGDQNEREQQANPQNRIPAEYEKERLDKTQPR